MTPGHSLGDGQAHIWVARFDSADIARMKTLLSAEEAARVGRFHDAGDARRYIFAHGVLRSILSEYTGISPSGIIFDHGLNGKPGVTGQKDIKFNLSHSGDLVLIAIARCEIGVDVEFVKDLPVMDMEGTCLSAREAAYIRSLPPEGRVDAFFRLWVRKEAYLKATGKGLTVPPGDIDSFTLQERAWNGQNDIVIIDLEPAPGYLGAVSCADGSGINFLIWGIMG